MTSNERQNRIIRLLDKRRYDTIDHLAQEFSVSHDTISRDIITLQEEYPLYIKSGRNGGVFIEDGYTLYKKKYMTPIQVNGLRCALLYVPSEIKEILETILADFAW